MLKKLTSEVLLKILVGIFTPIGLSLWAYLEGWWPALWAGVIASVLFFLADTRTPNWLLLVMAGCTFLALLLAIRKLRTTTPQPTDYCSDLFFNMRWRWAYAGGRVHNLATFCPRCDLQIVPHDESGYRAADLYGYRCTDCATTLHTSHYTPRSLYEQVELQIEKKLRSGAWREVVDSTQAKGI